MYAHTQPGIWSRLGPLLRVLEEAAVSDPELRRLQRQQEDQRHDGVTRFARLLRDRAALRADLSPERAADLIVTLGSYPVYDSLVNRRGWTHDDYEAWLTEALQHALLS
jgi:hypothetical protein